MLGLPATRRTADRHGRQRLLALSLLVATAAAGSVLAADRTSAAGSPPSWLQWGGPDRNFSASAHGIAGSWPESGPERLWSRPLGEGYSAILFESGRLYTMASAGETESVVCLDADSGETLWEYRYEPPPYTGQRGYGVGPRSTPLISGDLLFTIGMTGRMHALNTRDGTVLWSRDLWGEDFRGNTLAHGYSSSPVVYEDMVIVPVGGENASLVAFDQTTGRVRWKTLSFRNSYSSPRIVELLGETQLLVFMAEELIGIDPADGALRWRYAHGNQWNHNITMPLVVDGNTIFLSSPQAGAKGLLLSRDGGTIQLEEIWSTRRIQLYHASTVRSGDWVYGSTGVTAPAFMTAVNLRTGEIGWRERGFAKANVVAADGRLVILDEDGVLSLATATPDELVIHASTQLLTRLAWTVPTIVGRTMYVRDREQILAVNLG